MSYDFINTIPRFHTAVAEWMACVLLIWFIPKKRFSKLVAAPLHLLALLLMLGVNLLNERVPLPLWTPVMLLCLFTMYSFLMLCGRCTWVEGLYYLAAAFIIAEFGASLGWQIFYYISQMFPIMEHWLVVSWLVVGSCLLAVDCIVAVLLRRRRYACSGLEITRRHAVRTLLIALIAFGMSNSNYVFSNTVINQDTGAGVLYIRTLFDLAGLIMLFVMDGQLQEAHLAHELAAVHQLMQRQYDQYRMADENLETMRRMYHDLKQQIALLRAGTDSTRMTRSVNEMEQTIRQYESQMDTGCRILDTLLSGKAAACAERQIAFTCAVDGAPLQKLDAIDLCSIFGNAIDNAIEFEEKLPDPQKRFVRVQARQKSGFSVIRISNYTGNPIELDLGQPVTTKEDKLNHGYGLKSIRLAAQHYNGNVTITQENGWFHLNILIPAAD